MFFLFRVNFLLECGNLVGQLGFFLQVDLIEHVLCKGKRMILGIVHSNFLKFKIKLRLQSIRLCLSKQSLNLFPSSSEFDLIKIFLSLTTTIMQSITDIDENKETETYNILAKLDRLLRVYRAAKKNNFIMFDQAKLRVQSLMNSLYTTNPEKFKSMQSNLRELIESSLIQSKTQAKSVKSLSSKVSESVQSCSFGQNNQQKSTGNRMHKKNGQDQNSKLSSFNSISQKNWKNEQLVQFRYDKKQDSKQHSLSSLSGQNKDLKSYCQANINNLESKLEINDDVMTYLKEQSPDKVAIIGVQKPQNHNSEKQMLFLCTFMEFSKDEVVNNNYKNDAFNAELEEFENVIRCPLVLSIIGTSINAMKIHYVKFLLEMTAPVPFIIIFNQENTDQSLLVRIKGKCIDNLSKAKAKDIERMDNSFLKNKQFYKIIPFSEIPINQEKCITTKFLERKPKKKVYENKMAIMIQNNSNDPNKNKISSIGKGIGGGMGMGIGGVSSSNNLKTGGTIGGLGMAGGKNTPQNSFGLYKTTMMSKVPTKVQQTPNNPKVKIQEAESPIKSPSSVIQKKQEKKVEEQVGELQKEQASTTFKAFNYKVPPKFLSVQVKENFYVYLINDENEFYKRKTLKTIKETVNFIKENPAQRCCIELIGKKDGISSEILLELFNCKDIVDIFSLRLKALQSKKVFFFRFKEQINSQAVSTRAIQLKQFQADTQITKCIIVLNTSNVGGYETKNPYQQI